jgi:hypothetical protein
MSHARVAPSEARLLLGFVAAVIGLSALLLAVVAIVQP